MKKIGILLLLTSLFFSFSIAAQKSISFYRNDGLFNQMKLEDGVRIAHKIGNNGLEACIIDWMNGETSIPLSAVDSCLVRTGDIPVLKLSFPDYPDADCLWEKDLYLRANLDIEGRGYTEDVSGLTLQVKGRGNSTWEMPKKPMRLKFPHKVSICGLKKAKSFVLLSNYLDPSLMRNTLALWLANRLGMPYTNSIVPCHVFINGNYAGAYTLTEKIGINSSSVDIDENEGILLELSIEYDEKYKFRSKILNLPVMIKDPDFDELFNANDGGTSPNEEFAKWEADYNSAENLAYQGRGAEAFDMESAVNYYLLYKFVSNREIGTPKSLFLYKKSLNGKEKYHFGPAWDFDVAFNFSTVTENGEESQTSPSYDIDYRAAAALLKCLIENPEFKEIYERKVQEFKSNIFPELLDFFDNYASMIEPSAKINGMRWPKNGPMGWYYLNSSYETSKHISLLRDWLVERASYLNLQ